MSINNDEITKERKLNTKYNFYQVVLAIVSVAASVFVIYQQFSQSQRLREVQLAIHDNQDIRNALSKPLEGVWSFRTYYKKFHGEEGDWESAGKAIFTWRPNDSRYEIFMGTTIIKRGETGYPLVTIFGRGLVAADYAGNPGEIFEIEFEYEGRTGVAPYDNASYKTFAYKNCALVRDQNGKINKIVTSFTSHKSEGEVIFTLERK